MKRIAWIFGVLAACSSGGGGDKKAPIPDAPTELVNCPDCGGMVRMPVIAEGLAQNIVISEIAAFQVLKVPIMKDGKAIDDSTAPKWGNVKYAARRDGLLRLYLTPGAGFAPHPIVAQLRFISINPSGYVVHTLSSKPYTPKGAGSDGDLGSTLNIDLPGSLVLPDTSFSVWLTDADQGKQPQAMDPARWPQDGSLTAMGSQPSLDKVRLKLVPMKYMGQVPDTSDGAVEAYRKQFYGIYPGAAVEVSVRDPYDYPYVMDGSLGAWGKLLDETGKVRSMDSPDPDIYYYSIIPSSGGGGIAGISGIGSPWSTGIADPGVATHEVGHAHGLEHAPCGGAALGGDMGGPYPDAGIGVWGYDQNSKKLIDPSGATNAKYKDFMGYCQPTWVSDYHYNQLTGRVQSDNRLVMSMRPTDGRPPVRNPSMFSSKVRADGTLEVDELPHFGVAERGIPREIDVNGVKETGYWFPYDHIPGGFLMVSDSARLASKLGHARIKK
jgi:hypothetical protein